MNQYSEKDFAKIIKHNAHSLRHNNLSNGTDVMRIYDRNLEDFPVTVELYSNWARIVDFGENPMSLEESDKCCELVSRFAYIDRSNIVFVVRAKRENRKQHEKTETAAKIVFVKENSLIFKTDLSTYTDTGLFLDQVNSRLFVRENSLGKNVLNLFSYTGSFSVYAASGGAKTVTSVDLSATYTSWAQENLKLNGFFGDNYQCICEDAKKFVTEQLEKSVRYDIIVFDPPSFSNSHKMEYDFDVQRDYVSWIKNLVSLLSKDGIILFSTNLGTFRMDKKYLRGLKIKEITAQMRAEGFVKGRIGTVRSWIMRVEDESLSLDWSDDKRDRRENHDNNEKRYGYGKSKNRYGNDRQYGSRNRYSDNNNVRRFEKNDRNFENNRRFEGERRFENGRRFEGGRRFSDDKRRFEHREPRDFSEGRGRSRRFDNKPIGERRFSDRKSGYSRPKSDLRDREKPYGYNFKSARSRDDSSEYFWNIEDLKSNREN